MIFRLDTNQGIYIHYISFEESEIIPPLDTGFQHVEDFEKTGTRTATRTNLNPPPGQKALAVLKLPTFITTKKG